MSQPWNGDDHLQTFYDLSITFVRFEGNLVTALLAAVATTVAALAALLVAAAVAALTTAVATAVATATLTVTAAEAAATTTTLSTLSSLVDADNATVEPGRWISGELDRKRRPHTPTTSRHAVRHANATDWIEAKMEFTMKTLTPGCS